MPDKLVVTSIGADPDPEWTAPLGAHPSAVSPHHQIESWVLSTHVGIDNVAAYRGHAFLYNISLQTLSPENFKGLWVRGYGKPSPGLGYNFFHAVHLMIPYHKRGAHKNSKPLRIADWLNCSSLEQLYDDLNSGDAEDDLDIMRWNVLRKTWVSFVEQPPADAAWTASTSGSEYAIAAYLAWPTGDAHGEDPGPDAMLARAIAGSESTDPEEDLETLAACTKVLLGAGIDEPFSTRENGCYQYDLIISFANRSTFTPTYDRCAIKRHLKVLCQRWMLHKPFPQPGGKCDLIERNSGLVRGGEMRLDAFLVWARYALQEKTRSGRRFFQVFDRIPLAAIEIGEKNSCLRGKNPWNNELDRFERIAALLHADQIRIEDHQIVPGFDYVRRNDVRTELKTLFVDPIVKLMRKQKDSAKNSSFIIAAASSCGKTTLKDALEEYLNSILAEDSFIFSRIDANTMSQGETLKAAFQEIVERAEREAKSALVVFDEFQNCENLGVFANDATIYTLFDVQDRGDSPPVVGVFMTSECDGDQDALENWFLQEKGCRKDLWTRSMVLTLPSWNVEDSLLILLQNILKSTNRNEFSFEKDALEFLLLDQPYAKRRLINSVLAIVQGLPQAATQIKLSDFPHTSGRPNAAYRQYVRRKDDMHAQEIPKTWLVNTSFLRVWRETQEAD